MQRIPRLAELLFMAGAAGPFKKQGMGRLFLHVRVGRLRRGCGAAAAVADGANDAGMPDVQLNRMAVPAGIVPHRGWGRRGRRFLLLGRIRAAAGTDDEYAEK